MFMPNTQGARSGRASIVYNTRSINTSPTATTTFTSMSIGTESGRTGCAIFLGGRSSATITSVTIGGVAATQATGYGTGGFGFIYYAAGVTGTTASVVINFSSTPSTLGCAIFSIYTANSITPVFANYGNAVSTTPIVVSCTSGLDNAMIFGVGNNSASANSYTFASSPAQTITEVWDEVTSSNNRWAGGNNNNLTQGTFDLSATPSVAINTSTMCVAIWN